MRCATIASSRCLRALCEWPSAAERIEWTRTQPHAIADSNEAIRLGPKNAVFYSTRGEAYEAKNDPDHAIADFNQALKLDPSLAEGREGRERAQVLLAKRSNPGAGANAPAR